MSEPAPVVEVVVTGPLNDAVAALVAAFELAPECLRGTVRVRGVDIDQVAVLGTGPVTPTLVHVAGAPEIVLTDLALTHEDPADGFVRQATAVLDLAAIWPPERWVATSVDALVSEPESELQRVFAAAGLGWHPRASRTWGQGIEAAGAAREGAGFAPTPSPGSEVARFADALARLAPRPESSLRPESAPGSLTATDSGLGDLLAELESSLLVSTYQTNRLISLHPRRGGLGLHLRAFDRPMGIALTPNGLSVATRSEIIDFRNLAGAAPDLEPPGTFDACLLPRTIHVTGDIAAHDLGFGIDGLWVVATQFSCLATLDADHSFVPQWQPPFITELAAEDRCHLNGMALVDGRPRYVTALGASNEPGGWRPGKADGGVVMAVPGGAVVASGLSMPHSPRWHHGRLYVLDSGRGRLVTCNPATGELTTVADLPGFTRGLSLHGNLAFVGTSQVRETATFGGLPVTDRGPLRCGVWAIDLVTGEVVASVVFEDRIQELFDVAFLPGVRRPEIGEPGTDLVRTSWSVPCPADPG